MAENEAELLDYEEEEEAADTGAAEGADAGAKKKSRVPMYPYIPLVSETSCSSLKF